jgi:predicted DNA-binding protein
MTISVRLDDDTERALRRAAKEQGISNSELVRQCLHDYLDRTGDSRFAWELGKEVFGKYGSGRSDLSTKHEEILRDQFRAKRRRR